MIGIVLFIGSGFYVGMAYLFVMRLDLGIHGIAFAFDSFYFFNLLLIGGYCAIANPFPGTLFCFRAKSFKGIWDLFKFELFSGSIVYFESVGEDVIGLFAAVLSPV